MRARPRKAAVSAAFAALPLFIMADQCPAPPSEDPLDWNLRDTDAESGQQNTRLGPGASLRVQDHHYYLTLRAREQEEIRSVRIWGHGKFSCVAKTPPGGVAWRHDTEVRFKGVDTPWSGSTYAFTTAPMFYGPRVYCGEFPYNPHDRNSLRGPFYVKSGTMNVYGEDVTTRSLPYNSKQISLKLNFDFDPYTVIWAPG